jgi:hypothetical protein
MFRLRSPIVYIRKEPKLVKVGCFSCASDIWVAPVNVRVINYCASCG